jgi:hypothetical protein
VSEQQLNLVQLAAGFVARVTPPADVIRAESLARGDMHGASRRSIQIQT